MKLGIYLAGMVLATAAGLQAATIELKDGRVFDGDIIGTSEYSYFMLADGLRYEFPRSKVVWFSSTHANIQASLRNLAETSSETLVPCEPTVTNRPAATTQPAPVAPAAPANPPVDYENPPENSTNPPGNVNPPEKSTNPPANVNPPESNTTPPPNNTNPPQSSANPPAVVTEPKALPVSAGDDAALFVAPQPELSLPLPDDERVAKYLREAVQDLSDEADPGLKPPAIEALRDAGAHGLAILVESGLYNIDPTIRTHSVQMLGTLGQDNVLRYLIEAFQTAASAHIPSDQISYVGELTDWISVLTNEDFYIRDRGAAPGVSDGMAAWWARNWMNVPRQLGEPQLDPEAPDYMAQLKELRRLQQRSVPEKSRAR
jgi:hypothetical protein